MSYESEQLGLDETRQESVPGQVKVLSQFIYVFKANTGILMDLFIVHTKECYQNRVRLVEAIAVTLIERIRHTSSHM